MIQLLDDQAENDRLFRKWAEVMVAGGTPTKAGWVIEGTAVVFSNYGHGEPGTIENQVMLGLDQNFRKGVVKIVQPETGQKGKGKLTAIGRDGAGRPVLLRQGWLKKNTISAEVRQDFARLSGLKPIPVEADGQRSAREWFVVARLDADADEILASTVAFANACARARSKKGGRAPARTARSTDWRFGLEKGQVTTVTTTGGTKAVESLQGYVWEQLREAVGATVEKIALPPYSLDAVIRSANMLIEIKTGVSPHDVYEAVGQLMLYPSLIDLPVGLERFLLAPDEPVMEQRLAAALDGVGVRVFHYSISRPGEKPKIDFTQKFLSRCRRKAAPKPAPPRRKSALRPRARS